MAKTTIHHRGPKLGRVRTAPQIHQIRFKDIAQGQGRPAAQAAMNRPIRQNHEMCKWSPAKHVLRLAIDTYVCNRC